MKVIRPARSRNVDSAAKSAPSPTFSGAILLASGLSVFSSVAMTGFTLALTMIWPG
jgi:hypothetical protein